MVARLSALIPQGGVSAAKGKAGVRNVLETFAFEAQRRLQKYPAAKPWKNPPPKTGLRRGGRRTGTLGKNWTVSARSQYSITVQNRTPYASYVQGPSDKSGKNGGQTDVMAERGWPNVTEVGEAVKEHVLENAQIYVD